LSPFGIWGGAKWSAYCLNGSRPCWGHRSKRFSLSAPGVADRSHDAGVARFEDHHHLVGLGPVEIGIDEFIAAGAALVIGAAGSK